MPVIGVLRSTPAAGFAYLVNALRQGLNDAGFVEGKNVAIEHRWADNQLDRLPGLAADLVRQQMAVIVASGIAVPAVKAATATTPIVFLTGADPVRTGLVASLSRPGGNVTGVAFAIYDLVAKLLGLLHELVPKAPVIAVLHDPNGVDTEAELRDLEEAGRAIGRQILIAKAANEREFNGAFATVVQAGAGGLLVGSGPFFLSQRRQLVTLAARHALPTIYNQREYAEVGGLISYGSSSGVCFPPRRHLRWADSQRREARRPAGRAGDQVRVGHQPRDCEGAQLRHSADATRARRRGDRMRAARVHHAARRCGGGMAARGAGAGEGGDHRIARHG